MTYLLGRNHHGHELVLDAGTRRLHLALVGATGTGKSTLLRSLMADDLSAGRGFALIDPHGDLATGVADIVPENRINDVLYFDPLDPSHAVGFNPLDLPIPPHILADDVTAAFKHIYGEESWGPRLEYILRNSVRLLLSTPGSSLVMLPRILVDAKYRKPFVDRCDDPAVRLFWEHEYEGYSEKLRAEAIAPIQNKVGQFTQNPMLRAIIGQRSQIDVDYLINNRKVLICNLQKRMGEAASRLLGALLVTAIAQAAQNRATIPEEERLDFTLYVDEFQNFATDSFAVILSEMRKWRLNLVLANQFLGQVPETLRQSVLGNVGTLAVFRVGAEDAPLLADQLDFKNARILADTSNHQAWVKTTSEGAPTSPVLVKTEKSADPGSHSLTSIIKRCRSRYSRRRATVDAEVSRLFPKAEIPKKRKNKPRW